jgi:hypothetical protein
MVTLTTLTIAAMVESHPRVRINKSTAFSFVCKLIFQVFDVMKEMSQISVTISETELR